MDKTKLDELRKMAGIEQVDEFMDLAKEKSPDRKALEIVLDQIRRAKQSLDNDNMAGAMEDINKAIKLMISRVTK